MSQSAAISSRPPTGRTGSRPRHPARRTELPVRRPRHGQPPRRGGPPSHPQLRLLGPSKATSWRSPRCPTSWRRTARCSSSSSVERTQTSFRSSEAYREPRRHRRPARLKDHAGFVDRSVSGFELTKSLKRPNIFMTPFPNLRADRLGTIPSTISAPGDHLHAYAYAGGFLANSRETLHPGRVPGSRFSAALDALLPGSRRAGRRRQPGLRPPPVDGLIRRCGCVLADLLRDRCRPRPASTASIVRTAVGV